MRRRKPLPPRLGEQFTTRNAAAAGVGRARRDAPDLSRPFHGVRATQTPRTFWEQVDCYRTILRPQQRFVARTAVRIWGLPHPRFWSGSEPLEVAVVPDAAPPRGAGVKGRRLAVHRARTWVVRGAPVVDPIAALFTCAAELSLSQTVVMLDALLTTSSAYPGIRGPRPLVTREAVQRALADWGRFPGCATVRQALALSRERVESPKETQTRLIIVGAGLPEPEVQFVVHDDGRFIARVDLAYPRLRIAIEYEGDGHRTDKQQWRIDIRRQRELEDLGWVIIRLTEADIADPTAFLRRLHRAVGGRQVHHR